MDLLSLNYGSDDEGAAVTPGTGVTAAHKVDAAPAVLAPRRDFSALVQLSNKQINVNLTVSTVAGGAAVCLVCFWCFLPRIGVASALRVQLNCG